MNILLIKKQHLNQYLLFYYNKKNYGYLQSI